MTISDLITMAEHRLAYLSQLVTEATRIGDTLAITAYQESINETQDTLNKLKTL